MAPVVTQAVRVSSGTPVFWLDLQLLKSQLNLNGVHLLSELHDYLKLGGVRLMSSLLVKYPKCLSIFIHKFSQVQSSQVRLEFV